MKCKTPEMLIAAAAIGLLAASTASAESDIDLRGGFGYDSNAFELSDVLGERKGYFTEADATVNAVGTATKGWHKQVEFGVGWFPLALVRTGLRLAPLNPEARVALRAVRGAEVAVYEHRSGDSSSDHGALLLAADQAVLSAACVGGHTS